MAKVLKFAKMVETYSIEIGDKAIEVTMACDDQARDRLIAKMQAEYDRVMAIQKLNKPGLSEKEQDKLQKKLADVIAPTIIEAIGEKAYDEILTALGGGRRIAPKRANSVMACLWSEVWDMVQRRQAEIDALNGKAAHYLQGNNATTEPDQD